MYIEGKKIKERSTFTNGKSKAWKAVSFTVKEINFGVDIT